jgi:hypothetical protein
MNTHTDTETHTDTDNDTHTHTYTSTHPHTQKNPHPHTHVSTHTRPYQRTDRFNRHLRLVNEVRLQAKLSDRVLAVHCRVGLHLVHDLC